MIIRQHPCVNFALYVHDEF
ncbi:hypothetical protein TOT_030000683 [Theileria orientalis strain Shintoku]|uniref:Uncharacterized protein n=1 Tax=Theileria orientalis strain Shintoku TaxID=869250 RepID=J4CDM9_THEOR|nr:hypothetical protein TOT_030000683 [Theileria orientalis strain Shintoku]BAM41422.1 hypothetical protein TOT_030000683 [Theileria orientalis strain Shintoku]|eukprot:XP_009691723.1 hypothetical protein TOT_030000683 [Theileria orientalis strain Shintoku]